MRAEGAMFAEFETPEALAHAVDALRALGYARMEAYTPYPMPELEEKLGIPRSWTPRVVFAFGVVGAAFAFLLQYWLDGVDYPLNVGGRPLLSAPAFVPIAFETTILFASLAGFVAWLGVSRLPTLDHPVFDVEGFLRVSIDRFWLAIAANDPSFEKERSAEHLRAAGAVRVVLLPGAVR